MSQRAAHASRSAHRAQRPRFVAGLRHSIWSAWMGTSERDGEAERIDQLAFAFKSPRLSQRRDRLVPGFSDDDSCIAQLSRPARSMPRTAPLALATLTPASFSKPLYGQPAQPRGHVSLRVREFIIRSARRRGTGFLEEREGHRIDAECFLDLGEAWIGFTVLQQI